MLAEKLKNNIESKLKTVLPEEEWIKLQTYCNNKIIKKKEILLSAGEYCKQLYFVEEGLLYSSQITEDFEKQVTQIACEDHWISDLYSFFSGKPAFNSIEALEASRLVFLSKSNFEEACLEIPRLERFFRILFQNAYVANQQRLLRNMLADASTRYQSLLENQPDLVNRIPLYLLASYLGIKPQSLSRIRKNLQKK